MTNKKLQSLPKDLREIADDLVATKFKEPEVVEDSCSATLRINDEEYRVHEFKMASAVYSTEDISEYLNNPTTMFEVRNLSTIDERLREVTSSISQMPRHTAIKLVISFKPQGEFPPEKYEMIRRLNEGMEFEVCGGTPVRDVVSRIKSRLIELERFYRGHFYARLEKYEFRSMEYGYGYPY